ncbi:MAG: HRDC domain-containing protein [Thermoanaerobaculia bacterium]|nr:HRDC domain-containing protein [Thermoanaerobaculia bacterium]
MTNHRRKSAPELPPHRWVEDAAGLRELGRRLDSAPAHALDTESNSGFVYRERLCLLQVNVSGELWLIDLLALPGEPSDLDPIRSQLESGRVRTWLHGGEFDVGSLKRDYRLALGGVWDTQQAVSFLGWEKTGYANVVDRILGVQLEKGYAHYDWGRRPIDPAAVRYALDDVVYLPQIAEALEREVAAHELEGELEVANETVMAATWGPPPGTEGIWRIKGARSLDRPALERLVALWEWREAEAKLRDLPPGRLLNSKLLLALAKRPARSARELAKRGLRGRLARYADDILRELERAAARPPRVPDPPPGRRVSPGESRRLAELKRWRRREAKRRDVPQPVVLPPTAMQYLAQHGGDELEEVPQLGEKRIALYGERLRGLCSAD